MTIPDSDRIASHPVPPQEDPPDHPFSCSTNLSKEALDHLRRMHLSGRAYEVCLYAHNLTFGNAGWHRQQGKSELSCTFDLASWAEALGINRSNLQRIIARLVLHQIISFTPLVLPGRATFTWNANFAEWQAGYDSHRTPEQAKNLGLHSQKKIPSELSTPAITSASSELSTVESVVPPELSLVGESRTTRTKEARSGVVAGVASPTPNKSTEEEYTEEKRVAYATQEVLLHSGFTDPHLPIAKASPRKPKTEAGYEKEKRPRANDEYWQTAARVFGYQPKGGEVWNWRKMFKQLREDEVTAEQLEQAAIQYKKEHPSWRYSLQAVFDHIGELISSLTKGANNGQADELGWNVFTL